MTYQLELDDRNISADVLSCYTAVDVARNLEDMSGVLYVNDTEPLHRPECQELQFVLVAHEQHKQLEAKTTIFIIFEGKGKHCLICLNVLIDYCSLFRLLIAKRVMCSFNSV